MPITKQQVLDNILEQVPDNNTRFTTPEKMRDALNMVVNWAEQELDTINAKIAVLSLAPILLFVGSEGSPDSMDTTYTNAALIGKLFTFEHGGEGALKLDTDYSFDTETGLITLLASRVFYQGENYTIRVYPAT